MRYEKLCKIDGCVSRARQRGRCKKHYRLWRKENPIPSQRREPESRKALPTSPHWGIWDRRKNDLCTEWMDIKNFVRDIQPFPGKGHRLCKLRHDEPYGPTNFTWRPQIKRLPDESMSDYSLRLRVEQLTRFPNFERDRLLIRNYRLTPKQYERMLKDQGHVCAICRRPEKALDRTGAKIRNLAVDHCHESKEIRGLLCLDCNVSLGRMGESVEHLEAMIRYIKKHEAPKLTVIASNL